MVEGNGVGNISQGCDPPWRGSLKGQCMRMFRQGAKGLKKGCVEAFSGDGYMSGHSGVPFPPSTLRSMSGYGLPSMGPEGNAVYRRQRVDSLLK